MTNKITLTDLANLQNETTAVTAINANNAVLITAINNTLSRDGTSPNTMAAQLDMNSNRILNLPTPVNASEPLRMQELINFTAGSGIVGPKGDTGATGAAGSNGTNGINGVLTNTRLAKTANYTVLNADKGSTIALGGTAFYTLTFSAASGYDATFAVLVVNEDSTRGKRIVITGGTNFIVWPGQSSIIFNDNNVWQHTPIPRWQVNSATTIFIDPVSGSSTNDGLASGAGAVDSSITAMTIVANQWDVNSVVKIKYAAGTYSDLPFTAQNFTGSGSITVEGDTTTPSNVLLQFTTPANAIISIESVTGIWTIQGFKLSSTAGSGNGNGLFVKNARVVFNNIEFGALLGGFHITAIEAGILDNNGNYKISGGANTHVSVNDGAIVHLTTGAVTITTTPAFSGQFASTHGAGAILGITPAIYSGSATGTRWKADLLSLIDSGALSSLPGNADGTPASGVLSSNGAYAD